MSGLVTRTSSALLWLTAIWAAWGHNFSAAFSRDRNVTDAIRDGGTRSISNSSVQIFSDMMRLGPTEEFGAAIPCPVNRSRKTAAPTPRIIQKLALIPA